MNNYTKHHLLDDTDLNSINNTFEKIDITFKSIEKSMNTRMNSLEKSVDDKHKTLVFLISAIGILLTILKVFL